MASHTWGWENDPRLNQAEIYCEECGELCGRGSKEARSGIWYCSACVTKDEQRTINGEKPRE